MKELEAREKWCPMARLEGDYSDELGANRTKSGRIPDAAKCIGSDCMMWVATDNECAPTPPRRNEDDAECSPAGYCGLGGRP